jgi:hypothetical protein
MEPQATEAKGSFAQVTVERERHIMAATDELLRKLCTLDAKIFGETPSDPNKDPEEKQAHCFQNGVMRLQKQTTETLKVAHTVIDRLNKEFDIE